MEEPRKPQGSQHPSDATPVGKNTPEQEVETPAPAPKLATIVQRKFQPTSIIVAIIVYGGAGLLLLWNNQGARDWVVANKWPLGIIGLVVLGVVVVAVARGMHKETAKLAKVKIGLTVFVIIPILLGLGAAIMFIPPDYQVGALRAGFLAIVIMLPATLYYLFIASRKTSLLQEYLTDLSRLGLFRQQSLHPSGGEKGPHLESEAERHRRVLTYVQKFEATYGSFPEDEQRDAIIEATDPRNPKAPRSEATISIFTPETSIPVVFATLLIGLAWLLTLPPWEAVAFSGDDGLLSTLALVLRPNETPVLFAFLGAYFFSLQMLFRRYVRKDLRASAYVAVTLRILLAIIGTWVVLQAADIVGLSRGLLVVGFVIGVFPPIAWEVIQTAFKAVTFAKFAVPSLRSTMPVSDLDGLTVWHEARLEEEDIENVPNMASADMVELMLHTRFPSDRIVDWVDQAILLTQLGPDHGTTPRRKRKRREKKDGEEVKRTHRQLLAEHGIRTASGLLEAYERSESRNETGDFEGILPGHGQSIIRTLVDTLTPNPNLELIRRWRRMGRDDG